MKIVALLAGSLALAKGQGTPSELSCSSSEIVVPQMNRWCEIENTPTVPVQASGCCNPTLNQIGEEDSQNNEGCRAVQTSAPYCPPAGCDLTSNNALEINLLMSNTDTQGVCCDTCYCVGDPLCGLWREGELTRDIFVTCDGRVKKGKQACKMSKNICTKQKDHHGKKCKWKQGRWSSFLENGSPCQPDQNTEPAMMSMYTVTKGGVRYSLDLTLGERGVIKSATYSRVGGSTSSRMILNSDDCFKYNPRKYHVSESGIVLDSTNIASSDLSANTVTYAKQAWMFSSPEMEALVTAVRLPNMVETEWSIVDPESGLEFDIRCSSPTAPPPEWDAVNVNEWVATSTRLDIPVAILPKEKAQDQSTSSTEGFCSSGGISLVQSTSRRLASLRATQSDATRELLPFSATSNDLEFQDMCFNKWVKDYVEACREIVSPTCNPVNYAGYVEEWCFKCSHGFADPPETCVDKLTNTDKYDEATISENWREYIVEMNSIGASENALALLRADISMFSYKQLFGRGYAGDIVSCALRKDQRCGTIADYEARSSPGCERGVSVEYWDDCDTTPTWREAFFIPASRPPCGNKIRITGDQTEYATLFKHKIRVSQCNLSPSCLRENRCAATPGFAVSFDFSMNGLPRGGCTVTEERCLPTPTPTRSPTEAPSDHPTLSPTDSPTLSPTLSPTDSPTSTVPTLSPTESPTDSPTSTVPTLSPTESPTESPTLSPTESPTDSPTSTVPTLSPTESPTDSPTQSPTDAPTPPIIKTWSSAVSWPVDDGAATGYAVIDSKGVLEFALARHSTESYQTWPAMDPSPYGGRSGALCVSEVDVDNRTEYVLVSASVPAVVDGSDAPVAHIWNVTSRHAMGTISFSDLEGNLTHLQGLECRRGAAFLSGLNDDLHTTVPVQLKFQTLKYLNENNGRVLASTCEEITRLSDCRLTVGCGIDRKKCVPVDCAGQSKDGCQKSIFCFWSESDRECRQVRNSFKPVRCPNIAGTMPQLLSVNRMVTLDEQDNSPRILFHQSETKEDDPNSLLCTMTWTLFANKEFPVTKPNNWRTNALSKTQSDGVQQREGTFALLASTDGKFKGLKIYWPERNKENKELIEVEKGLAFDDEGGDYETITSFDYVAAGTHYLARGFQKKPFEEELYYTVKAKKKLGDKGYANQVVNIRGRHKTEVENLYFQIQGSSIHLLLSGGFASSVRRLESRDFSSTVLSPGQFSDLLIDGGDNTPPVLEPPPEPFVDVVRFPWDGDSCEYVLAQPPTCHEFSARRLLSHNTTTSWMEMTGSTALCEGSCSLQVEDSPVQEQVISSILYPFALGASHDELEQSQATVQLSFHVGTSMSCCRTCSCWGDPECSAFGRTRKQKQKWVVCDSRSVESGCKLDKSICENTVDHKGRNCVWDPELAKQKRKQIQYYGSPCQSDWSTSGLAGMTMFKTSFFGEQVSVGLQMGERGIIERLMIRYSSENEEQTSMDLFASTCFSDNDENDVDEFPAIQNNGLPVGWNYTRSAGAGTLSSFLESQVDGVAQNFLVDRIRLRSRPTTKLEQHYTVELGAENTRKITLEVSCSRTAIQKGRRELLGGERLTVDLVDSSLYPVYGTDDGFCSTDNFNGHQPADFDPWVNANSILAMSDIPQIETPDVTEACEDNTPEIVGTCAGITGEYCEAFSAPAKARDWCALQINPSDCLGSVFGADDVLRPDKWIEEYCRGMSVCLDGLGSDVLTCKHDIINSLNPAELFNNFNTYCRADTQASCAESVSMYVKEPVSVCTHGMYVQTSLDGTEWQTEFFVPDDFLPCGENNTLTVKAAEHPRIFSHYVRFLREDIDLLACKKMDPQKACLSRPEFRIDYEFMANSCLTPDSESNQLSFPAFTSEIATNLLELTP